MEVKRMIAYKGFAPGLICRGYQFVPGLNKTEKANCRENGFHCAENPLDCVVDGTGKCLESGEVLDIAGKKRYD